MALGSRNVGYHSAVRVSGPPSLHPSNEPEPQTLIPAMMCPQATAALLRGLVLAPSALALLSAISDDCVPVAIRLFPIVGRDLKREASLCLNTRPPLMP